MSVEENNTEN